MKNENKMLFLLLTRTGKRLRNVLDITDDIFDTQTYEIILGEFRIPLNWDEIEFVKDYLKDHKQHSKLLSFTYKTAYEELKSNNKNAHQFRKEFTQYLQERNFSQEQISIILEHKTLSALDKEN